MKILITVVVFSSHCMWLNSTWWLNINYFSLAVSTSLTCYINDLLLKPQAKIPYDLTSRVLVLLLLSWFTYWQSQWKCDGNWKLQLATYTATVKKIFQNNFALKANFKSFCFRLATMLFPFFSCKGKWRWR